MRSQTPQQWHDPALSKRAWTRFSVKSMKHLRFLLPLLLTSLVATVAAQSTATKSLGAAKGGGKLLTREELRGCMNQQKDRASRRPQIAAERDKLERERQELLQIDESLKSERAAIDKLNETAVDINQRSKALSQQMADYNERVAKFQNANLSGPTAERQRNSLEREKITLDKNSQTLEAERAALGPSAELMVKTYDARAATRDRAAADWNARNVKLTQTEQAYEVELQDWKIDCEGRSYREDDEKAILSGK